MELFLNLVWFLGAVVLVCVWRLRWIPQRSAGTRRGLHEWSAISLALVLLFFAVSMSDDMHAEIVALEDFSASRRQHVDLSAGQDTRWTHLDTSPFAVSAAPSVDSQLQLAPLGTVIFLEWTPDSCVHACLLKPNRAPPVNFL
jgi:hypothetical protein